MRLAFGAPMTYIGARGLLTNARHWREARTTATWRKVPARIVEAHLEQVGKDGGHETYYTLGLAYTYAVDGRIHVGRCIRAGAAPTWYTRRAVQAARQTYLARPDVTVSVNPEDPSSAVLVPGAHVRLVAAFALGILSAAFGINVLLFGLG